jgi:hypothetical protein
LSIGGGGGGGGLYSFETDRKRNCQRSRRGSVRSERSESGSESSSRIEEQEKRRRLT